MTRLWRWLKRLALALGLVVVGLLLPPAYVELACRGTPQASTHTPLITDPDWQRAESRTLLTYPEWHIVHAYDDYARVIAEGDPHDFAYLSAIADFWTTLCPLNRAAGEMGEITTDTKLTIYTIGVSFTLEMLAKAAYEETLGRLATMVRGPKRSALDTVSAAQARDYAVFLQQTPWYKYDFAADLAQLSSVATTDFRDRERLFALRNEFLGKAWYARQIDAAVAATGADALRIRSVVKNIPVNTLLTMPGVEVIGPLGEGVVIETDRYRAFTNLVGDIVMRGGQFAEIAGNDEILVTATSPEPSDARALYSFPRQGYGDTRHLLLVPIADLHAVLLTPGPLRFEHIHDY